MKERYKQLLESGMFWELYPKLSGNWDIDKEDFINRETWLDNNFRNKKEHPDTPTEQQIDEFMKNEPKYHELEQLISKNQDEPLVHLKVGPNANLLPRPQDLIRSDQSKIYPTPILVMYLDIRDIDSDDVDDHIKMTCEVLDSYKSHGWENLVIPYKGDNKLEIAAVNIDLVRPDEFETFKKEILRRIDGNKSKDSE